jgi:FkbM family methyltransferase
LPLKQTLRRLRLTQPFNLVATNLTRTALRVLGVEWDLAVRHLHRVGTVGAALPNGRTLRLWSQADDWVSNQVFWKGWDGYEPETARVFFALAARARATLDVGAYVGYYAILSALASPDSTVHALEPHPEVYERLLRNVALNGLGNVRCRRAAAGAADGQAELFHVPTSMPTSSSLSLDFMRPAGELRGSTVEVIALDCYLREQGVERLDLVKVDTETTEPQVLTGMVESLRRHRPAIVCEVLPASGTGAALSALLGPLGYRYYLLTPDGPLPCSAIEGHPRWLNYLFTTFDLPELRAALEGVLTRG